MIKNICDEVGYWSEIKLDIIKDYAQAYTNILSKQPLLKFSYIDAFAGSGVHLAKSSGEFIPGSPLNALAVKPPFHEFHLIDINQDKADNLRILSKDYSNVVIYDGDCNQVLRDKVFPTMRYEDYRRSLCILDP
ncbi:MAG: three-Cys-motif partner protein TcmP, partial [Planctomycetota bacterium]